MLSVSLLVGISVAAVVLRTRRRRGAAGATDPRRDLAVLAMQLGRGIRSGLDPIEVLEDSSERFTGALALQLAEVCARMRRGTTLDAAMESWQDSTVRPRRSRSGRGFRGTRASVPDPRDVELLAVAARFGHSQGRGQAQVFEAVGATMIDRAEIADEVRALTAQARASVLVLCALPVMGLMVLATVDPSMGTVLLTEPIGLAALVTAASLEATALWVGSAMVRRALR